MGVVWSVVISPDGSGVEMGLLSGTALASMMGKAGRMGVWFAMIAYRLYVFRRGCDEYMKENGGPDQLEE